MKSTQGPTVACRLLLALTLAACGCTTDPLERPEVMDLAGWETVPRAVCIQVECEAPECYGDVEEWTADLVSVFKRLKVSSAVWGERERSPDEADMVVRVILRERAPAEPEVDTQGAFLDFLSWSTVPLLPLWIPDVHVDSGLTVLVARHLDFSSDAPAGVEGDLLTPPAIKTSMRERYPWASWSTLGAIFVPPFLFKAGDPGQLKESTSPRIRVEAAVQVAEFVKKDPILKRELLSSLVITRAAGGLFLGYEASPEVGRLAVSRDGAGARPKSISIPLWREEVIRGQLPLAGIISAASVEGELLRVEARSREDGRLYRYTVVVPPWTGGANEGQAWPGA